MATAKFPLEASAEEVGDAEAGRGAGEVEVVGFGEELDEGVAVAAGVAVELEAAGREVEEPVAGDAGGGVDGDLLAVAGEGGAAHFDHEERLVAAGVAAVVVARGAEHDGEVGLGLLVEGAGEGLCVTYVRLAGVGGDEA